MKRLLMLLPLVVAGCDKPAPAPWYSGWLKDRDFHSELRLAPGEITRLGIETTVPLTVGAVVEKGYELHKEHGSLWIGTPAKPHTAGGTPGVSTLFTPENGVIPLIVENGSTVGTRVVIYTQAVKPPPKSANG